MKQDIKTMEGSLELRRRLPRGGIRDIATKYNKTWQWIHKVVTGKYKGDPRILVTAYKMAAIEDRRRSEFDRLINDNEPSKN